MTTKEMSGQKINLWTDVKYKDEEQYREHVLEQYKLYLEMADRISSRRDVANAFFLTLNGAILAAAGALIDKWGNLDSRYLLLFPGFALLLQCYFWWRLILSYKQLNGAKFQIVGEFETKLPASPYREAEWHGLLQEGKCRKVYWPLTHLESKIPIVFAVLYSVALVWLIFF